MDFESYSSLEKETWIMNDIIDLYFEHFIKDHKNCMIISVHVGSVLFSSTYLTQIEIKEMAQNFTFSKEKSFLLMSVHRTNHFFLIAFDIKNNEFTVVDSAKLKDVNLKDDIMLKFDKMYDNFMKFCKYYNESSDAADFKLPCENSRKFKKKLFSHMQ